MVVGEELVNVYMDSANVGRIDLHIFGEYDITHNHTGRIEPRVFEAVNQLLEVFIRKRTQEQNIDSIHPAIAIHITEIVLLRARRYRALDKRRKRPTAEQGRGKNNIS